MAADPVQAKEPKNQKKIKKVSKAVNGMDVVAEHASIGKGEHSRATSQTLMVTNVMFVVFT